MTKKEETQLVKLLKKLYGKTWQFKWIGHPDGFSLNLEVYKTGEKPKYLFDIIN